VKPGDKHCSSETSVDFLRTIRRYFPEDSALHYAPLFEGKESGMLILFDERTRADYPTLFTRVL
jgi:hypothetical protein